MGAGSCSWKGTQKVLRTLTSNAASAISELLLRLMGHNGVNAWRHLHRASHPLTQPALAGKRAMRPPSLLVIHLTLGWVAEPCPVGKKTVQDFRSSDGV